MADEVGVAADRRGEVAVARRAQPGVADVPRRVARLLERAQDERRERPRGRGRAAHVLRRRGGEISPTASAACCGRHRAPGSGGVGDAERRELARRGARRAAGVGPLVHAVERRHAALLEQRRRPARWRRSSGARSAGATRSARSAPRSVTWPARSNANSGSADSTASAPLALARPPAAPRRPRGRRSGSAHGSAAGSLAGEDRGRRWS